MSTQLIAIVQINRVLAQARTVMVRPRTIRHFGI